MITLKYYNDFLNEGDEVDKIEASKPTSVDYDEGDNSYNFKYFGKDEESYTLKIFPQFDMLLLTFPDLGFAWCGLSGVRKSQEYFRQFENGEVYTWLLKSIMIVNLKTHSFRDSETLELPNDKEQD